MLRSIEQIALVVVVLVTQHDVEVVQAEVLGVVQQLLEVVSICTRVLLADGTASGSELTIVGVIDIGEASLVEAISTVHGQYQSGEDGEISKTATYSSVTFRVTCVEQHVLQCVGIAEEGT